MSLDIKELTNNRPSEALEAMVRGLYKYKDNPKFIIKVSTYGDAEGSICYGCMATCTIQELANKDLLPENIINGYDRANYLGFDSDQLRDFEWVIDDARSGKLAPLWLFYFSHDGGEFISQFESRWYMRTCNWEDEIPKVKRVIKELKEAGY